MQTIYGCGITQHEPECLCDVVVTTQAPIINDLRHGWHVTTVMQYTGLAAPFVGQTLLSFLEVWTHAHDRMYDGPKQRPNAGSFKSASEPWRVYAHSRFLEGAGTSEVRLEVRSLYNVDLTKSNAAHIRRRVLRGQS